MIAIEEQIKGGLSGGNVNHPQTLVKSVELIIQPAFSDSLFKWGLTGTER